MKYFELFVVICQVVLMYLAIDESNNKKFEKGCSYFLGFVAFQLLFWVLDLVVTFSEKIN